MKAIELKLKRRERRKHSIRHGVFGTQERPRLTVFRSVKNIYAQIIDDAKGMTLCEASSMSKELKGKLPHGGNLPAAKMVGAVLAERAKAKSIDKVCFDRNGYRYHGRIKALADAAREAGLKF